jgi:hypothetical protein
MEESSASKEYIFSSSLVVILKMNLDVKANSKMYLRVFY